MGTFGDAAFFSFGRDKVISSVFGGVAMVKDNAIAEKLQAILGKFSPPPNLWIAQQLFHPIVTWNAKLFYRVFGLGKFILAFSKALHLISKAVYPEEKRGEMPKFLSYRMPNALALLALHQFGKLERLNQHRKKVAALYHSSLRDGTPSLRDDHIFLRYTIRTPHAEKLLREAKKQNIFLGDWYRTPIAPEGVDYAKIGYTLGSCPTAEKLARETINLPTDIHISDRNVKRITEFLRKFT